MNPTSLNTKLRRGKNLCLGLLLITILHSPFSIATAYADRAQVANNSTNGFTVAINPTTSVQILPARTESARLSLIVRDVTSNATFYVEYGQAATTNSLPIKAGEFYSETYPLIDNRSVNVLGTVTGSKVHVQEKLE